MIRGRARMSLASVVHVALKKCFSTSTSARHRKCGPGLFALLLLFAQPVVAEPYLAVQQGMKCASCHVNPTGGGMRNDYGNLFAQMTLAAEQLATDGEPWTGRLNRYVAVGGDLRTSATQIDVPDQDGEFAFELEEMRLYLDFSPVPGRIGVYVDQRLAPGGSGNLEAYARYWSASGTWYVKAGQMYLPYGLRLEDDSAFIRQVPGINFNTPDRGVEVGWESPRWSAQVAVSNGTAGGPELDQGKQVSLRAVHVRSAWRLGASVNVNDTDAGQRQMQNLFAGLRTGPVMWLAEINRVSDDTALAGTLEQNIALLEANWLMRKGHNLKITTEYLDPDSALDNIEQNRYSLVWEYTPYQYLQMRLGARQYDGVPQDDLQNRRLLFLQLHAFF